MPQILDALYKWRDAIQQAIDVLESMRSGPVPTPAQRLGKRRGAKGGVARAQKLSPERRAEIARLAANQRWGNQPPYAITSDGAGTFLERASDSAEAGKGK